MSRKEISRCAASMSRSSSSLRHLRLMGLAAAGREAGCSPSNLVATSTGLVNNFSTPAAWPRTIELTLSDNCGAAGVATGDVIVSFSNGDAPLRLSLNSPAAARYSATWAPQHSQSQITVTATATAPGLQSAKATLIGTVAPDFRAGAQQEWNTAQPLSSGWRRAGARYDRADLWFRFGCGGRAVVDSVPLPTIVQGTAVLVGGLAAPLFYVSDTQVNAQIPFGLVAGHEYPVVVAAGSSYTVPEPIQLAPLAPGIARLADGSVIAQHGDFSLVDASSPAKPGEYLVVYLAGMGLTDNAVVDGAPSPANPLANVASTPAVTLGGTPVTVLFAG